MNDITSKFSGKTPKNAAHPVGAVIPFFVAIVLSLYSSPGWRNGNSGPAFFFAMMCLGEIALGIWIIRSRSGDCYWLATFNNTLLLAALFLFFAFFTAYFIRCAAPGLIFVFFIFTALIFITLVRVIRKYLQNTMDHAGN